MKYTRNITHWTFKEGRKRKEGNKDATKEGRKEGRNKRKMRLSSFIKGTVCNI